MSYLARQTDSVKLEELPTNSNVQIGIELEVASEGLFKTLFALNV